jgi:nucleoside-diphosphate-sugar epimerase
LNKNLILVTGATGHLGKETIKQMIEDDFEVLALGRNADKLFELEYKIASPSLITVTVDLSKPNEIKKFLENHGPIGTLVHLAAEIEDRDKPDNMLKNLNMTVPLLNYLFENLEHIIYLSTMEVYENTNIPITESNNTIPENYYGLGKLICEKFLEVIAGSKELDVTIFRSSTIFGPGEKIMRATTVFLDNVLKGKPICIYGDGSDLRDYIFVSDAARAIVQGIRKKKSGIYNLSGGEPVSIKSLAEKIVRISGKGIDIIYKERVQNKKNIHLENKKIKEEFDFVPLVSLDEGLEIQYKSLLGGIYD